MKHIDMKQKKIKASRRDFLQKGSIGLASLAGASVLGMQTSMAKAQTSSSDKKRVTILFDSWNHMMPALAREMVRRDHDLVLGQARDKELVEEFGGFNSACIRTGTHVNASALTGEEKDLDTVYEGNLKSVFYALKAIVPPLVEQKSGQVIINTSAGAMRPQPAQALYCATRQAANGLVRATGLEVAPYGVTVNATGTAGMEYPSYLKMVGAYENPEKAKEVAATFPMQRFVQPEDAASFVATLIDGTATGQTGQFFPIDAGWSFM
jgi:NAD(P)-dependent dehydrogenase (short-subunit alcohol dehydrogenase family)